MTDTFFLELANWDSDFVNHSESHFSNCILDMGLTEARNSTHDELAEAPPQSEGPAS